MVKLGIIQTGSYRTNREGILRISKILENLGRKNTDIVCMPEQWLSDNRISRFETEFSQISKIAREFSMTVIPGAFYQRTKKGMVIAAPVIDPSGEILGIQEKIHPFDYEQNLVKPGNQAKIFNTSCKFGIVICYDMVFPQVVNTLVRKGAQVIFSPSRIVKRGIKPWQMYVQVRSLENRVPILAANVQNSRFGGNSMIVDLIEKDKIVLTKITKLRGQSSTAKEFELAKYEKSRKIRFSDSKKFV